MAESIESAEKIGSLFAGEGLASVGEAGCEEIPEEPVSDESRVLAEGRSGAPGEADGASAGTDAGGDEFVSKLSGEGRTGHAVKAIDL